MEERDLFLGLAAVKPRVAFSADLGPAPSRSLSSCLWGMSYRPFPAECAEGRAVAANTVQKLAGEGEGPRARTSLQ